MHIFRAAACMLILAATGTSATAGEPASLPYRVVGGKVDAATFTGWQVYHQACYLCHGVDASGTALAPSLVDKLRDLTAEQFAIKVATSYRIILGLDAAGGDDPTAMREAMMAEVARKEDPILLMPAWEGDKRVQPHLSDLYAYLKARSDGALGPGKPRRLSGRSNHPGSR